MTSSADVARELEALEKQSASLRDALDGLVPAARQELGKAAAGWVEKTITQEASDHPSVVTSMGQERAREVKQRVAELAASFPRRVDDLTADPAEWPHRQARQARSQSEPTVDWPSRSHNPPEPYFDAVFRSLISGLGPILEDAGFLADQSRECPRWQRSPNGLRYAINPGFEARQHQTLRRYAEQLEAARLLAASIERMRLELERAKAKEVWDSA